MTKGTLIAFVLVSALIIYGLTRIPKFDSGGDEKRARSSDPSAGGDLAIESLPRSLVSPSGEPRRRQSPEEALREELDAKEQQYAERLAAILESDADAARFYGQANHFQDMARAAADEEGQLLGEFLASGSAEEQESRRDVHGQIENAIQIPELQAITVDPETREALTVAFENGELPISDEVDRWFEGIDAMIGYDKGLKIGDFSNSLEWMVANLEERSADVDRFVGRALRESGFPDAVEQTLRTRVRAELLSAIMSANFAHSDEELLALGLEIASLREQLGIPEE